MVPAAGDKKDLAVVILAAGKGSRMHSKDAKVLHRLADKPLVEHVIHTCKGLDPTDIIVVVGHQAEAVIAACNGKNVAFAKQQHQRGTGDAVLAAETHLHEFSGDILIVCGDVPLLTVETLGRFVEQHQAEGPILSVLTAVLPVPASYGRVIRRTDGDISRITESRDASQQELAVKEINTGIYCADAQFLYAALHRVKPNNAQKEYYLTDIVALAVEDQLRVQAVITSNHQEVEGINSRQELARMETTRQQQLRQQWMEAGVTFEDPNTVYLGEDIHIGKDTIVGPNTHIKGATSIGKNCRIEGSAYIDACTIGTDVTIYFSVVLKDCKLDDGSSAGPFSHMRGGAVLSPHAEVGNFVEVKKSTIGDHTKAKHLAYIGDAEIGKNSNIGAGTITCNYDGFRKHNTKIGDRVQVGSDTTLVAPVNISDDVYIATATTVRKDVPAGSLVFNRRQEETRPGWTAERRAKEKQTKKS